MNFPLMMPLPRAHLTQGKASPGGRMTEGSGLALLGGKPTGETLVRERHHLSLANGAALEATYNGSYDGNANLFKEQVTLTGPELLISRVLSGAFQRPASRRNRPDATLYRRRYSANCIESEQQEGESVADASDTAMSEGGDTDNDPEGDISSSCSSWPKGSVHTPPVSPSPSPDDKWWGREEGGGQDWAWVEARWLALRRLRRQIPPALEEKLQRVRARGWARGRLRGLQERVRGLNLGLGGAWRAEGENPSPRESMCRSCSFTFSNDEAPDHQSPSGKPGLSVHKVRTTYRYMWLPHR